MGQNILAIKDLEISFPSPGGAVAAVSGLDLEVGRGEIVGLVGESGSGKSLSSLAVMGLLPSGARISGGHIRLDGQDIAGLAPRQMRAIRGRRVSMVFQEPLTALNPALTIGRQMTDVIRTHNPRMSVSDARAIAIGALADVGIHQPAERLGAWPHQFSGGMRQRVLIAMAIACKPDLLIADEPTTALDVTVQAQIINLLRYLRETRGLSILLISHNLHLVADLCDRVVVMYAGRLQESGTAEALFLRPRHPYARLLQGCVPSLDMPHGQRLAQIAGAAPLPGTVDRGCAFAARCPRASARCRADRPLPEGPPGHQTACWHPLSPGELL